MNGVLVVSPLGALALASLLRLQLIEMLRAKLDKSQRAALAERLLDFVTTPQFKNRIEEIVQTSSDLQEVVQDEGPLPLSCLEEKAASLQNYRVGWLGDSGQSAACATRERAKSYLAKSCSSVTVAHAH
jgi:hypothetical protein